LGIILSDDASEIKAFGQYKEFFWLAIFFIVAAVFSSWIYLSDCFVFYDADGCRRNSDSIVLALLSPVAAWSLFKWSKFRDVAVSVSNDGLFIEGATLQVISWRFIKAVKVSARHTGVTLYVSLDPNAKPLLQTGRWPFFKFPWSPSVQIDDQECGVSFYANFLNVKYKDILGAIQSRLNVIEGLNS
jgi:hypothetical protein